MKQNRAAQKPYGSKGFKMFHGAVSAIGMRFSDGPNALYDTTDAASLLATMCKEAMCAEQASVMLQKQYGSGPGAD